MLKMEIKNELSKFVFNSFKIPVACNVNEVDGKLILCKCYTRMKRLRI